MALITAAEARLYIPGLTGTGQDTELDTLIARADSVLAEWCGYPPASAGADPTLEDVTYTEYYSGPALLTPNAVQLNVIPVQSITSAANDTSGDWSYSGTIASGDRTLDGVEGLLFTNPDSGEGWYTGQRAIKIVYVAGFATIPESIKQATALLVAHWWGLRKHKGKTNANAGQGSANLRPETIPESVRQIMAPFRLEDRLIG